MGHHLHLLEAQVKEQKEAAPVVHGMLARLGDYCAHLEQSAWAPLGEAHPLVASDLARAYRRP